VVWPLLYPGALGCSAEERLFSYLETIGSQLIYQFLFGCTCDKALGQPPIELATCFIGRQALEAGNKLRLFRLTAASERQQQRR
jgi:hypothetical protein